MEFDRWQLMVTLISNDPAATEAIGAEWGGAAVRGWVVGLSGDLGAGKTQLVKGIAKGLGINSGVHSPTFSIINIYSGGRLSLFHLDLYRLENPREIIAAGLEEYLEPDGVTVIEWAERWFGDFHSRAAMTPSNEKLIGGNPFRWAVIEHISETQRRISYEDFGA
jgi:tRNA threonylcarbamoyladenosine biosynthesis protein TsaE